MKHTPPAAGCPASSFLQAGSRCSQMWLCKASALWSIPVMPGLLPAAQERGGCRARVTPTRYRCSDADTLRASGEGGTQLSVTSTTVYSQWISSSSWQQNICPTKHKNGVTDRFRSISAAETAQGHEKVSQWCFGKKLLPVPLRAQHTNIPELGSTKGQQEKGQN